MSNNSGSSSIRVKKTAKKDDDDEVEALLRAAEDHMVLKLSVDSHISRLSSPVSYIHPDLDRRMHALRSKPNPPPSIIKSHPTPPPISSSINATNDSSVNPQQNNVDDLFARFDALKGSLPSYSSSSSSFNNFRQPLRRDDGSGGDDEDEVEKVIRWAVDAARLDPSTPSDDDCKDDHYDDDPDSENDDEDEDEDDVPRVDDRKKGRQRK